MTTPRKSKGSGKDYRVYMRMGIEEAKTGIRKGNLGFGAVIIKGSEVVARAYNTVNSDHDATAHAEVNAIRMATGRLKTTTLSGCILIATHQPCPMCASASLWAEVSLIVYGASNTDYEGPEWRRVSFAPFIRKSPAKPKIIGGVLKKECLALYPGHGA